MAAWSVDGATAGCCGVEAPMSCILATDPDTRTLHESAGQGGDRQKGPRERNDGVGSGGAGQSRCAIHPAAGVPRECPRQGRATRSSGNREASAIPQGERPIAGGSDPGG